LRRKSSEKYGGTAKTKQRIFDVTALFDNSTMSTHATVPRGLATTAKKYKTSIFDNNDSVSSIPADRASRIGTTPLRAKSSAGFYESANRGISPEQRSRYHFVRESRLEEVIQDLEGRNRQT